MHYPDMGFHISRHRRGGLTVSEVWSVSPSLCFSGAFTSAALHFWGGKDWLSTRSGSGPRRLPSLSSCLIISFFHKITNFFISPSYKGEREGAAESCKVAKVCGVKMACWRWTYAGKGSQARKSITALGQSYGHLVFLTHNCLLCL